MSVFVDDMLMPAAVRNGNHIVRGRWSHLMADTTDELCRFATRLSLQHAWIQKPGTVLEHFDITAGKRTQALQLGAIPIRYGEGAQLTACRRLGLPFDVDQLRRDPAGFTARLAQARANLGDRPRQASGPRRIQLSRTAGWRLPAGAVSVASPTKWANPFRPARRTPEANAAAVEHYRDYLAANPDLLRLAREELVGLDLACWCAPPLPCHADVLLAIANPPRPTLTPPVSAPPSSVDDAQQASRPGSDQPPRERAPHMDDTTTYAPDAARRQPSRPPNQ